MMSIRNDIPLVRGFFAWWFHSWRCAWKGSLGIFGYNERNELILIGCTCGHVFWVRS